MANRAKVITAYHGSPINGLKSLEIGSGGQWQRVAGVYFTKSLDVARRYIRRNGVAVGTVYEGRIRFANPADRGVLDRLGYRLNGNQMQQELIRLGYDGVVDDYMDEIAVFFPDRQIERLKPMKER